MGMCVGDGALVVSSISLGVVEGGARGGGAGCLGYWRRAAAPAADFTGFEAAEPIERSRGEWKFGLVEVVKLFAAEIGGKRGGPSWHPPAIVATQVTSKYNQSHATLRRLTSNIEG